ncbi:hypothetical protein T265_08140 [Opisthorchis viverrini]|uniref:Uncharacterized protein n=1 Tax=Opisthorchis viverrini TaxID=6198 RepID=A0A074ZAP7_OPIVI|nr:hypothetical protein T265_08140 [Opisthorchis viverrini]KER24158.1 hypothetical protein T265_08140 [Opisthorchis viverrini]
MSTHFHLVVTTLFVIMSEVRPLTCYVCDKCPDDLKDVGTMDKCPACVVEKFFDVTDLLRTNRLCGECPRNRITVTNNNRTVNDCCYTNLCLGSVSGTNVQKVQPATTSITRTETNTPKHVTVASEKESIPVRPNKTDDLSMESTAKTATQHLENSSSATCHMSAWYLAFSTSLICLLVACFN